MTPRQMRQAANGPWDGATDTAGRLLASWAILQARLREIVRRPYAVIEGEVRPLADVLYRDEGAMK